MATYTHGHHESVLRSHTWRTVANSAAYLRDHLVAGTDVLDVGCGPGTITVEMAGLVAPGRVVGVDASAEVVAAASDADTSGAVEFRTADATALPFGDDGFGVVHAHQLLQHVADPVAVLREMARVTRPGGVVAARDSDYAGMFWHPRLPALDGWLELYRTLARGNGGEPDAGRRLLSWALEAGFDAADVTATASVWCFATPEDRAWWGGLWADRVSESDLARQAVDRGLATTAGLERLAAAWREWAGQEDGWFLVPHGEILARVPGFEFVPSATHH